MRQLHKMVVSFDDVDKSIWDSDLCTMNLSYYITSTKLGTEHITSQPHAVCTGGCVKKFIKKEPSGVKKTPPLHLKTPSPCILLIIFWACTPTYVQNSLEWYVIVHSIQLHRPSVVIYLLSKVSKQDKRQGVKWTPKSDDNPLFLM